MIQASKKKNMAISSFGVHWKFMGKRAFSCSATNWTPVKVYKNVGSQKDKILFENKGKSGIYR
jgi:hypothetical protein